MLARPGENICLQFRKKLTKKFAIPWLPKSLLGRNDAIGSWLGCEAVLGLYVDVTLYLEDWYTSSCLIGILRISAKVGKGCCVIRPHILIIGLDCAISTSLWLRFIIMWSSLGIKTAIPMLAKPGENICLQFRKKWLKSSLLHCYLSHY